MRIINLIVVHCTATQGNEAFSGGFGPDAPPPVVSTEQAITTTSAKTERCILPALSNASVHTQKVLMPAVSESAMKAVWTVGDARQTPGRRNSVLRFGC